jgi:hypothetical protein
MVSCAFGGYAMHVLLRFFRVTGKPQGKDRRDASNHGRFGSDAGISTFLRTLPLAFSTSEILHKLRLSRRLVTVGCGHGLILLPVALSPLVRRPGRRASGEILKEHASETSSDRKGLSADRGQACIFSWFICNMHFSGLLTMAESGLILLAVILSAIGP